MRGLSIILSLFCNEFDKFNNTKARMLDYIYHMTFRLHVLVDSINTLLFYHYVRNFVTDVIAFPRKSVNP